MVGLQLPLLGEVRPEDAEYGGQVRRVRLLMEDGRWRSGVDVARFLGCTDAAATARVRDLRKEEYGSHLVERRRFPDGVHRYRLVR